MGHAHTAAPKGPFRIALLTVSDTRTQETDRSGSIARTAIEASGHAVFDYRIVPDEPAAVRSQVEGWLGAAGCDAVVVNGGTGISARDRTYEALAGLVDVELPGFGELFRALSFEQVGSAAMLSRALAGIARGRPVFAIPGSPAAVELAMTRLILPELSHVLGELRKEPSGAHAPPGGSKHPS